VLVSPLYFSDCVGLLATFKPDVNPAAKAELRRCFGVGTSQAPFPRTLLLLLLLVGGGYRFLAPFVRRLSQRFVSPGEVVPKGWLVSLVTFDADEKTVSS